MSAYSAAILGSSNLLGYWRLGESAGTVAADETANVDLAVNGSPTWGAAGAIYADPNTALSFNGSTQSLSTTSTAIRGTTGITILGWLKSSEPSKNHYVGRSSNGTGGWALRMFTTGATTCIFQSWIFVNSVAREIRGSTTLTDGAWHMLATRYDGSTVASFLDGAAHGTQFGAGSLSVSGGTVTYDTTTVNLGSWNSEYGTHTLDEVAIWSTGLSSETISYLYKVGAGTIGNRIAPKAKTSAVTRAAVI